MRTIPAYRLCLPCPSLRGSATELRSKRKYHSWIAGLAGSQKGDGYEQLSNQRSRPDTRKSTNLYAETNQELHRQFVSLRPPVRHAGNHRLRCFSLDRHRPVIRAGSWRLRHFDSTRTELRVFAMTLQISKCS